MNSKTIFLDAEDNAHVYTDVNHSENYANYMLEKHPEIEITEYIPHLLMKYHNHVIIDYAYSYMIVTIYLPNSISNFQKDYIRANRKTLEGYRIFFEEKQEDARTVDELLSYIETLPIRKTHKEKTIK